MRRSLAKEIERSTTENLMLVSSTRLKKPKEEAAA